MDAPLVAEQAQTLVSLLPTLMRRLFAMEDDPAAELPLAQLRVCVLLVEGPRAMSALSRELGVSLSAVTQLADRLERAGLVNRVAEGTDRRVRCLQLTEQGEKVLQFRNEVRTQRVRAVLEQLSPGSRRALLSALETLVDACVAVKDCGAPAEMGSGR